MLLGILGASLKIKKLYCVICDKYIKFKNLKISYIFQKTLALYIICSKCKNENEETFKEEESIEILKIIGLIENIITLKI